MDGDDQGSGFGPPNPGHGPRQRLQMFGPSAALTHLIQQMSPEEQ